MSNGRMNMNRCCALASLAVVVVGAVACGDSKAGGSPANASDGGADSAPTAARGASNFLKAGANNALGITPGGLVVYLTPDYAIETIPIAGGDSVRIAPPLEPLQADSGTRLPIKFSNGALAWWTQLSKEWIGTLNVWNEVDGVKIVSTTSTFLLPDQSRMLFAASDDGRRVAFSTNATAEFTNLQVVDVATATSATGGVLADGDLVRYVDACANSFDLRFVGKKLFSTFCASNGARAVVVPDKAPTAVRVDDRDDHFAAIGLSADDQGNKVFYADLQSGGEGRFVDLTDLGAITRVPLRSAVKGVITKDGSAVVYLETVPPASVVKRWPTPKPGGGNDDATVIATNVSGFEATTKDRSRVVISDSTGVRRMIDTATASYRPGRVMAADASAQLFGFTGSGNYAVYTTRSPTDFALMGRRTTGGMAMRMEGAIDVGFPLAVLAPEGDGVAVAMNPNPPLVDFTSLATSSFEVRIFDLEKATWVSLGDGLAPLVLFAGKKVLYGRIKEPGMGLYVYDPK